MSNQYPLADFFARIKNAQAVAKQYVAVPASKFLAAMATVLQEEGYIDGFAEVEADGKSQLELKLRYFEGRPVISKVEIVSRPGLRIYKRKDQLPKVKNGLGIAIVSTSRGVMSDRSARRLGQGGEVVCYVS